MKEKFFLHVVMVGVVAQLLVVSCFAMSNNNDIITKRRLHEEYGSFSKNSSGMKSANTERLREFLMLLDAFEEVQAAEKKISDELNKLYENDTDTDKKNMLEEYKRKLTAGLQECFQEVGIKDDNFGRAIAAGLAGKNWEVLRGRRIGSVIEGAQLGALMSISRATGDVLSKRIENSIDRVLGGSLDSIIGVIMSVWSGIYQFLFHDSAEPFTDDRLSGWHKLVTSSLENLERQLKDGLKEISRSHDMTLRQAEKTDHPDTKPDTLNAWKILTSGYVRQFVYVAAQIESHTKYYHEEDIIVFYAKEIIQRLQELAVMIDQTKSLKELDALIDANKGFVPAMRKNITDLFARLAELVKTRSFSTQKPLASGIRSSDTDSESRSSRASMSDFMMNDEYPRSMGR